MISHRTQFCFAGGTKSFNVANEALAFRKHSAECLIHQMLNCLQEFSTFNLQQLCVRTTQIQQAFLRLFGKTDSNVKAGTLKQRLKEIARFSTSIWHDSSIQI